MASLGYTEAMKRLNPLQHHTLHTKIADKGNLQPNRLVQSIKLLSYKSTQQAAVHDNPFRREGNARIFNKTTLKSPSQHSQQPYSNNAPYKTPAMLPRTQQLIPS
eukprot:534740_1